MTWLTTGSRGPTSALSSNFLSQTSLFTEKISVKAKHKLDTRTRSRSALSMAAMRQLLLGHWAASCASSSHATNGSPEESVKGTLRGSLDSAKKHIHEA